MSNDTTGQAENDSAGLRTDSYALAVANSSFDWYRQAAIRSRGLYRIAEIVQLVVSAAIPVTAVLFRGNTTAAAILGAVVVVVGGLRAQFHWHEDYLRFSQAREAVEAERRLYHTKAEPYAEAETRDAILARAVTSIEQNEMSTWVKISATGRGRGPH